MALDFTNQDLRNRSFRGEDLRGAVFHASDLRGADFSGANLTGADLSNVSTGTKRTWTAAVIALALVLSVAMGLAAGFGGRQLQALLESQDWRTQWLGVLLSIELVIFLVVLVWRGFDAAVRRVAVTAIAVAVAGGAIAVSVGAGSGKIAFTVVVFTVLLGLVVTLASGARAVAGAYGMVLFMVVAMTGAVAGGMHGGGWYAAAVAIAGLITARRALRARGAYPRLLQLSIALSCRGGTRFRNSNLSGASFASAKLSNTDFRGAVLDGTRFDGTRVTLCSFDPETPGRAAH